MSTVASPKKPFRLQGGESQPSVTRDVVGRFARADAVPANPLAERKPAINDQQTMSGWAPGIGQGSAQLRGQQKPYPPIAKPASKGFKVS